MLTKVVEIPAELYEIACAEYEVKWPSRQVTFKRFTYGDILSIQKDSMKVKATMAGGGSATADIDPSEIQVLTVLKGIVSAPWQVNDVATIKSLPPFIAEWARAQVDEFNTLGAKKKA